MTGVHETDHRNLLVIDDDDMIRESLRQALEFEGYTVHLAANGKEGLEWLKTLRPCVILLDLMMPVMDGWRFAEALEMDQARNSIPILVVSAFSDKAKGIRCHGIVRKPFDLDHLLLEVKKHCH